MRFAAVAALATLSSGCLGTLFSSGEGDEGFVVADLRRDARWVQETADVFYDFENETPVPVKAIVTTTVLPGPLMELDAYGGSVECIGIESRRTYMERPASLRVQLEAREQVTVRSCIETASGTWLVNGALITMGRYTSSYASALPIIPPWEWKADRSGVVPIYPTSAEHYATGTLIGESLFVGQTIERRRTTPVPNGSIESHQQWTVLRAVRLNELLAVWPAGGRAFEVASNSTATLTQYGQAPRNFTASSRLWMVEGVHRPVLTERLRDGEAPRDRSVLLEYRQGTSPLGVGQGRPVGQYNGTNPRGTFAPFSGVPPLAGVPLEFGLPEALAWVRLDPRALAVSLWLRDHPKAYLVDAEYVRDVGNKTFEWHLHFHDDGQGAVATVRREEGPGGAHILEASGGTATYRGPGRYPGSDEARSTRPVDGKTAFDLAMKFLPNAQDWRVFQWRIWPGSSDGAVPARYQYELSPRQEGEYRPTPIQYVRAFSDGPSRNVHAADGRLISGATSGGGFSSGFGIDGPI